MIEDSPFKPVPFQSLQQNNFTSTISIGIGNDVPKHIKEKLRSIHQKHEHVFNGDLTGGYNGYTGNFDVNSPNLFLKSRQNFTPGKNR